MSGLPESRHGWAINEYAPLVEPLNVLIVALRQCCLRLTRYRFRWTL